MLEIQRMKEEIERRRERVQFRVRRRLAEIQALREMPPDAVGEWRARRRCRALSQ